MSRPKRFIQKPSRYQTTSSEDERCQQKKKNNDPLTIRNTEINEDINELKEIMADNR